MYSKLKVTPKNLKEYYEKEALLIKDHQKQLYFGNPGIDINMVHA